MPYEESNEEETLQGTPEEQKAEKQLRAQTRSWLKRLKCAREFDKDERDKWETWRDYVAGDPTPCDDEVSGEWLVSTNLISATMDVILPFIYAKDPDVSVSPADSVDPVRYEMVKTFSKTLQTVVSRLLKDAKLKRRMQRAIRGAMTIGGAWLKVTMQLDRVRDPIIERQINDIQDNLLHIERLKREIENPQAEQDDQMSVRMAELEQQLASLENKVEVMVARGLVIDVIQGEDMQVDDSLLELLDYDFANWIAQRIWYTKEEAKAEFGLSDEDMEGYTTYEDRKKEPDEAKGYSRGDSNKEKPCLYACWEIWDAQTKTVHTIFEGAKRPARPPFSPDPCGERWYPFFYLAFHYVDGRRHPVGDVKSWHKLQDEYSRTRSSFALHRQRVKPARMFDKSAVSPEDAKKLNNPEINEFIGVDRLDPSTKVEDLIHITDYPKIDGALYDTAPIRADLEQVSGAQDAMRSAVVTPKTATEANILAEGMMTRISMAQAAVEDILNDLSVYVAELALDCMLLEDVQKIAGPGAVWPELPREEIFSLLSVSVRAGSAGKPDTAVQQQQWATLMPQITNMVVQISQAEMMGQLGLAEALKEVLRESVLRVNDKIDVERFIPKPVVLPMLGLGGAGGAETPPEASGRPPMGGPVGVPRPSPTGGLPGAPGAPGPIIQQPRSAAQ